MFPYKNQDKKDWLVAAAKNNVNHVRKFTCFKNQFLSDHSTAFNDEINPKLAASYRPIFRLLSDALGCQGNVVFTICLIFDILQHDNDELIRSLLKDETNYQTVINKQSNGGYTPLHIAAINKAHRTFSVLMLTYKADRNIRDHSGKTATSYLKNVITSSLELKRNLEKNYGQTVSSVIIYDLNEQHDD